MPDGNLPGYEQPFGTRKINVSTHQGPVAYAQGGETINASTFGWGSIDFAAASVSFNANNSGNYVPQVLFPVGQSPVTANNNWSGFPNMPTGSNSIKIKWVAANGTEANNNTNLSSEFTRLAMWGG